MEPLIVFPTTPKKLFLLERPSLDLVDEGYRSAVVVADSENTAKLIHPSGKLGTNTKLTYDVMGKLVKEELGQLWFDGDEPLDWVYPASVLAIPLGDYIGVANNGTVICADRRKK